MGVKLVSSSGGSVELVAPTTASNYQLTVPATADTLATQSYVGQFATMRNRIINGAMMIDQRNAGASVTPTTTVDGFPVDRFTVQVSQNSKVTAQQNAGAVTPPSTFTNYVGVTSSSAYSVLSTDYFLLSQKVEGFSISDFGWGTANAQAVTLSFWVRSSLTGTFSGSFNNAGNSRNYLYTYTINSANTWEYKTVTIPGDTSGTWATNNSLGVAVRFCLGAGSTYTGTANTWQAGNLFAATGATSVVGTSGATFYITGVQLEKGSTATSFDYRPYGTELALCQRYYEIGHAKMYAAGTTALTVCTGFRVTKRANPTMATVSGSFQPNSYESPEPDSFRSYRTGSEQDFNWTASAEL